MKLDISADNLNVLLTSLTWQLCSPAPRISERPQFTRYYHIIVQPASGEHHISSPFEPLGWNI